MKYLCEVIPITDVLDKYLAERNYSYTDKEGIKTEAIVNLDLRYDKQIRKILFVSIPFTEKNKKLNLFDQTFS